jgi:hypothetical protein
VPKRWLLGLLCLALLALPLSRLAPAHATTDNLAAMRIGVTFSQHEAEYRDLPVQQAFNNVLDVFAGGGARRRLLERNRNHPRRL